jgi:aryl-alcohol dehydrogenase-like predicted oxidoreductase
LPPQLKQTLGVEDDAATAIQFARSATNLATSLVGMGRKEHVQANLKVATQPPIAKDDWESLFTSK